MMFANARDFLRCACLYITRLTFSYAPTVNTILTDAMFLCVLYYIVNFIIHANIKTHDSELQGQHTQPLSELFTCSTAMKFANALAKPP